MALNLDNISKKNKKKVTDPKKIFDILPNKDEKYDGYLRDVQSEVLTEWELKYKNSKDLILKMNTGSGKTVCGLLILQSQLNRKRGPSGYFVPDNYLLQQVIEEADSLNIRVSTDTNDPSFLKGESILIANIYKLVNGKSVFGVNEKKISLGSIIVDDAHACIDICKQQTNLFFSKKDSEFSDTLFQKIRPDLVKQSNSSVIEYENGERKIIPIPFWALQREKEFIQAEIYKYANFDGSEHQRNVAFNKVFISDRIDQAEAFFTQAGLNISLRFAPIDQILSLSECPHRIFMSATIEDESTLVSQFELDDEYQILSPKRANDIGERLILVPQGKNPKITDDEVKRYLFNKSTEYNVVVLVPNYKKSLEWGKYANRVQGPEDNIDSIVNDLKNGHVGLVVIVSRYDGLDIPKKACEILAIDGVPEPKTIAENYEEKILRGVKSVDQRRIRTIEQGMGRGVRSKEDYCVVFLLGADLIKGLYVNNSVQYFSPAAREQLELSDELLGSDFTPSSIQDYEEAVNIVLSRDDKWISSSREYISDVEYSSEKHIDKLEIVIKDLYNKSIIATSETEISKIEGVSIDKVQNNNYEQSYIYYLLAKAINNYNPGKAQELVKKANQMNSQIIRPMSGIAYNRVSKSIKNQSRTLSDFLHQKYSSGNQFLISIKDLLNDLSLESDATVFESAICMLGEHLGFSAQLPEKEVGKGPDDLWLVNNDYNFVIECKNEASSELISKKDCNQLNGSIEWFENIYTSSSYVPILVHKSRTFEYAASPNKRIRILDDKSLIKLKRNVDKFAESIASSNFDVNVINSALNDNHLRASDIESCYTRKFLVKRA